MGLCLIPVKKISIKKEHVQCYWFIASNMLLQTVVNGRLKFSLPESNI